MPAFANRFAEPYYGPEVVAAARVALDDLAHGRVTGKALGARRASGGRPIDAHADWDDWKALLKEVGIRDARLHDARHTAATLLLAQDVDQRVVMEILGHSQIGMTAR